MKNKKKRTRRPSWKKRGLDGASFLILKTKTRKNKMPIKETRFRFKTLSPRTRVRLAYVGQPGKVVETTIFRKQNGWVKSKINIRSSGGRRGTMRRL